MDKKVSIKVNKMGDRVKTPVRQSLLASGFDVFAYLPNKAYLTVAPGEAVVIPTGLKEDHVLCIFEWHINVII